MQGTGLCPAGTYASAVMGSCYLFEESMTFTWYGAKSFCGSQQSYVVEVNSLTEMDILLTFYGRFYCGP